MDSLLLDLGMRNLLGRNAMRNTEGKTAVVTGGSRGSSAVVAERLAAGGANVVVPISQTQRLPRLSWRRVGRILSEHQQFGQMLDP